MATTDKHLSRNILVALCFLTSLVSVARSDPILSCSQTPYPQVCASLMSPAASSVSTANSQFSDSKTQSGAANFRDLALQATRDRIALTHQLASSMDTSSLDERAKAAWADCLVLCEDMISQIARSINAGHEDSQTWLSAAIANQETCRNGFIELNATSHMANSPFMATNISETLSNSLAINKAFMGDTVFNSFGNVKNRKLLSDGFPSWVTTADRKLLQSSGVQANIVVAQDGSGNYKTISEAVAASANSRSGTSRFVIYVKAGTYNENVQIGNSMKNLMLVGDGIDKTVVTGNKNVQDGSTTFNSATFAVTGGGFIAQDMTFENTAGPQKQQAVALRSGSDLSIFYRCSFKGYQDTLYVYSQRQFYRNCDIYGTVDFIFGDAVVVFQGCNMYLRMPMANQQNTVTAQGRSDPNENTGISIHESNIAAAESLGSTRSYLGRPWKAYSRTVVMETSISSAIDPAGWLPWSGNFALNTLYYGEYMNTGGGSGTGGRVNWGGFHIMTTAEAIQFTVGNFLGGGSWISAAGVPFTAGL